jgi:beta-glucosidase
VTFDNASHTATVKVSVTNTGKIAGKDVVEVYAQAPYTDYDKKNLVEKSAIQLMNFGKTDTLQPGASQTLTVTVDMKYLASFDANGAKTYIMDAGDYYFAIGNGAHDAVNNILNNTTGAVYKWNQANLDTTTYAKSANGTAVKDELADLDFNYYEPGTVTYLSRSDWQATWPKTYANLAMNSKLIDVLRNNTYTVKTGQDTSKIFPEKKGNLTFSNLKGVPYNDPSWNDLLDELTLKDAAYGIAVGGTNIKPLDSIKMISVWQSDGPNGFSNFTLGARDTDTKSPYYVGKDDPNYGWSSNGFPNEPLIAATYNQEIAKEFGNLLGEDSLWNNSPMLWAPGLNLHRVPYNGRLDEYFSEDPMLSNLMGTAEVRAGQAKGLIMGVKHFAFNDQETNRYGIATFMTEQAARENALRAFQGPIADAGAMGMMSAYNRAGAQWVNADQGLMQNILRQEWGFKGLISSDMVNNPEYMNVKDGVLGGITMFTPNTDDFEKPGAAWAYWTADGLKGDAQLCTAIRDAYHHHLCAVANSNAMNGYSKGGAIKNIWMMTWWRAVYIAGLVVFGLLSLISLAGYTVVSVKKEDK